MTDGAIFTDIPTLGNYYTGTSPINGPGWRMKRAGAFDPSRRFAPIDGGPDAARVLALGTLPSNFGDFSNGLIMVYSAYLYEESRVTVLSGRFGTYNYRKQASWELGLNILPPGTRGAAMRRVVRAAVHKPVADPADYKSGWTIIDGFGWRNGAPRSTDPTPWTDGSYTDDSFLEGQIASQFYTTGINEQVEEFFEDNFPHMPTVVHIGCQRNGPNAFIFVREDGTFNYDRSFDTTNRYNGIYQIKSDLSVTAIPIAGTPLFDSVRTTITGDWLAPDAWLHYFYFGHNVYVDDGVDPTFFFTTRAKTNLYVGGVSDAATLVMTVKLSELVSGSEQPPLTPVDIGQSDGFWRASGRVGASMHLVPGRFNEIRVSGTNISGGTAMGQVVHPWSAGDGPPELWFFLPVSMRQVPSTGYSVDGVGGNPDNWEVTFDIYRSHYTAGALTPAMTRDNSYAPIQLTDDSPYSDGVTRYPRNNPLGMAFEADWFDTAHKVGSVTLPNLESDFDIHSGQHPVGLPDAWFVGRNPKQNNQLLLGTRAPIFERWKSWGGGLDSQGGTSGAVPGQTNIWADGSGYSTYTIWTAISNDDGKTWKATRLPTPPYAEDVNSSPPSYGQLFWLDSFGTEPVNPINDPGDWDFAQSRYTVDSTGRIVMGLTRSRIYYTKADGVPTAFWSSPADAGLQHGLFFPQGIGRSNAQRGDTGVKFKRVSRR